MAEDLMMAVKLKSLMMKATMITTHHLKKKTKDLDDWILNDDRRLEDKEERDYEPGVEGVERDDDEPWKYYDIAWNRFTVKMQPAHSYFPYINEFILFPSRCILNHFLSCISL